MNVTEYIAKNTQLSGRAIENTISLLEEGATLPFISRYRKEQTGGLDEVEIEQIKSLSANYAELAKRKTSILKAIDEQGKLNSELKNRIDNCFEGKTLEDIYLPYKLKRKTKAEKARQQGLEPLAKIIMSQNAQDVYNIALKYTKGEIQTAEDAIAGALHIVAEYVNERESTRNQVRYAFENYADITAKVAKGKAEEGQKYRDYFDYVERLNRCPSHRILALFRAEKEGILKVDVAPDKERTLERLINYFVKGRGEASDLVAKAVKDAYQRLLKPSIETEFRNQAKKVADEKAINVFAKNLRQLLLAPPVGGKRTLALDPGFRSGCKLVCLDAQGSLLHNENIFPHPPQNESEKAKSKIFQLVNAYKIEAIAIGNGTAGRETESLIKKVRFDRDVEVYVVNEDGASVYSASSIAREEFPNYDVTVRGAVNIGRRLMDPLAELVKIDPKAIGVGQYQHDVDQGLLKSKLDQTVESCVNAVGVDLNTASKYLLTYISGLGPQLAQNIVDYRAENGNFTDRKQLKKVKRMGDKAFEQCAGFLRIRDGKNPLDNTGIHPERYSLVDKIAKTQGSRTAELVNNETVLNNIKIESFVSDDAGELTLKDILAELAKPGRDPRGGKKIFSFSENISGIGDLRPGMKLPGVVSNLTSFGAFVDLGIKENGLIHVSEMANHRVTDPTEVLALNQQLLVTVKSVDIERKRIGLSLKE